MKSSDFFLSSYLTLGQWLETLGIPTDTVSRLHLREMLALLIVVLLAWAADRISRGLLRPAVQRLTRRTHTQWDDYLLNSRVLNSACHVIPPLVAGLTLPLAFPYGEQTLGGLIFMRGAGVYITAAVMRLLYVFLGGLKAAADASGRLSQHYISSFIQLGRLVVTGIGLIIIVSILINRSPGSLLAGLGVAATVLMLVFKDTLTGLVAGVQLAMNDMLSRGDWITMDKAGVNGIVEDVTLTTVKVRNFDNTIVTIPPQTLMSDSFKNWRGMRQSSGRRVNRALYIDVRSIRFCTAAECAYWQTQGLLTPEEAAGEWVNLTLMRRWAERYLHSLADVDESGPLTPLMVRQLAATPQGLPVEFYFFLTEKTWKPYEMLLAEIMEHIMATLPRFGLRLFQYAAPPHPASEADAPAAAGS